MIEEIEKSYSIAKDNYQDIGVDVQIALEKLETFNLSIHCWQGDDVSGFESPNAELSGGGIQVTGDYPGRARTVSELRQDFEEILSLIPGIHRINLHAIYGEFGGKKVDRNQISINHFQGWIDWAKKKGVKLDFNPTLFSHPKANEGFTLSHKSQNIREFWIEHVKRCREISAEIGKQLNDTCIHNIWIPDGMKDIPIDRRGFRLRLKDSLDEILAIKYPKSFMRDSLEGKLFGIGSESFVVGSHDFYLSYAISNRTLLTLDTGHYHPTESVADKISAILPFIEGIVFHLSRGVRWDSDHVAILNDDLISLAQEIVKCSEREKTYLCTDWFDASINRISAYVIGLRAILKALLLALLQPWEQLKEYEGIGDYTHRLALLEDIKALPFGAIWNYYCNKHDVPLDFDWMKRIEDYEKEVLFKR